MNISHTYLIEEPSTTLLYEVPMFKNAIIDLILLLRTYGRHIDAVLTLWTTFRDYEEGETPEPTPDELIEEKASFRLSEANHFLYNGLLLSGGEKLYCKLEPAPNAQEDDPLFSVSIQLRGIEDFN